MARCVTCGHANPDGAKFCSECGTALAPTSRRAREERKVVSVVFVDLVGSTARAETSDPEDVRALLRVYHERSRTELERFGGTVEKFIGDAVVAVFGAPVAHEDDPERAVRAALAVRDAVGRLNEEEPGRDLHVRIAVNTGEALVSLDASPGEGEGMVAGDVVNTAARLQSAAPVDGILVGEGTYRATDRAIAYREAETVEAKGKREPILVWEAIAARSLLGVDIGGVGKAELIGRDGELELLAGALARSRRERSTQLVTIVGVPGMGKSRLVLELSRLADADDELITWRQGRSLPYGEGVSYWALGEIVKAQAGILETDGAVEAERKLADTLSLLDDRGEREWVARHLRPLLGLEADDASGERRGEAFVAWRRFLESLAATGPCVLVFEDLHWADEGLLDFVDNLVDWVHGVPLLVVGTARPELLERRPGWGGGKRNATTISLASLDDDATARLVLALRDQAVVDAAIQRSVIERAAGNPLYAEEFVRVLDAGGTIDGRLPDTVQGIIAARIDLLPEEEKRHLQNAAVLGKVFWSDALGAFGGAEAGDVAEILHALERKEFLRREHRSTVAGAVQYAFVHALVRDAAYGQLPRAARAERHLAVARWMEELPADRAETRAETLAHHYLSAIKLYRSAGQDTAELAARAVPALHDAGERALNLGAYETATRFLEQALAFLPRGAEPSAELLFAAGSAFGYAGRTTDLLTRAVEAFEATGEPERAAEAAVMARRLARHAGVEDYDRWLDRAVELVENRPASRAKALVTGDQAHREALAYRREAGKELAERAIELAQSAGDAEIEGFSWITRGMCRVALGDAEGVSDIEQALALVGRRGYVAGRAYSNLGSAYALLGRLHDAHHATQQAVEHAEREGDHLTYWFAKGNLIADSYGLGDWDGALELAAEFENAPEGARVAYGRARSSGAEILLRRGQVDALDDLRAWCEQKHAPGARWRALVDLARATRLVGLEVETLALVDELNAELAGPAVLGDPNVDDVKCVLLLRDTGHHDEAGAHAERLAPGLWRSACDAVLAYDDEGAADLLASTGGKPIQSELRLSAAIRLAGEGQLAEAHEQLAVARAFWEQVGATVLLRQTDDVIAAVAPAARIDGAGFGRAPGG